MKNNTQVVQYSGNRNYKLKIELATTETETTTFSAALQVAIRNKDERIHNPILNTYSTMQSFRKTTTFASEPTTVQIQTMNKARHYKTWPFQTICEQGDFKT
jgi:hypothetical protein